MKAIVVKRLGPTDTKGARVKAYAEGGNSVTISAYSDSDNIDRDAAVALCRKLRWTGSLAEGGLPNGDRVFVFCEHKYTVEAV